MAKNARRLILAAACTLALLWVVQVCAQVIKVPADILTGKNPLPMTDAVLARAKTAYTENCVQCHGQTGKGDGPMAGMLKEPPANLSDGAIVGPLTDGEMFWVMTKGKPPAMPVFESKLSNQERWSLVHFLRNLSKTKPNTHPRKK
jgi:mono/diheme cytochrome c family protein